MSQHSSLKARGFGVKHRNVLKRFERIKKMKADGRWQDAMSPFGLPKIKSVKIKVKKIKAEAKTDAAAGTAAPAGAPAAAAPGKTEAKPRAGK